MFTLGGLGVSISLANSTPFVGWATAAGILILLTTWLPIYEYFQLLTFSVQFFVTLGISFVSFLVYVF